MNSKQNPTKAGPRIVVVGNEKGGSGKSTTAMHIAVNLLRDGASVACIDLDQRQGTISRYFENRETYAKRHSIVLPIPEMVKIEPLGSGENDEDAEKNISRAIEATGDKVDTIIIDAPGNDNALSRAAHSFADILLTPLNDSFIDLDVLARINSETGKVERPSHYAEMVWVQKLRRAKRDGGSIDWIVMRNRLGHTEAQNKKKVETALDELSSRIGFRQVMGFSERVIFRELFLQGLTLMDVVEIKKGNLAMSHIAARNEVRTLMDSLGA
ncbi:MAG: division plane positioning ATPase MipZ [Rhodospirillaceae bacterium]|nr:division plane positioning ATPase MipZ [Rhodospirillaceae bacterium]